MFEISQGEISRIFPFSPSQPVLNPSCSGTFFYFRRADRPMQIWRYNCFQCLYLICFRRVTNFRIKRFTHTSNMACWTEVRMIFWSDQSLRRKISIWSTGIYNLWRSKSACLPVLFSRGVRKILAWKYRQLCSNARRKKTKIVTP